jgi:glycosyltransferase involved in cell wall biosynthesis
VLRVLSVLYVYPPDVTTAEGLLERYSTVVPWARALRDEGVEVTVLVRFHETRTLQEAGICYAFHADSFGPWLNNWQVPVSFHSAIRATCGNHIPSGVGTVVLVHGLFFPLQTRLLRASLPPGCVVAAQHHAERPSRRLARPFQKWGLRAADGFFFAAREIGHAWADQGLISKTQSIFEVMEGSTSFRRVDRAAARAQTGMSGNPVVLWVGRLIPLKDPLTVLRGFEQVVKQLPEAKLYMAFGVADLLPEVRECLASSPHLSRSVILPGNVEHSQMEQIYNSADYFVLGSHYEGSSFSLVEAMACGVVPVVTDIPSLRAMTNDGRIGACWAPGSATAFADAFLEVAKKPLGPLSDEAVHFFHEQLSYPAIARNSIRAYDELIASKREATR